MLEPLAREPSLVSFSISIKNHIILNGFHVCLYPGLVSGLLSSSYDIYCTVYSIQCNGCTACSLYVWLSGWAKPKQKLSLNGYKTQNSKLNIENKILKTQI